MYYFYLVNVIIYDTSDWLVIVITINILSANMMITASEPERKEDDPHAQKQPAATMDISQGEVKALICVHVWNCN